MPSLEGMPLEPFQLRVVGGGNIVEEIDSGSHSRRYYCSLCQSEFFSIEFMSVADTARDVDLILEGIADSFRRHVASCPSFTNKLFSGLRMGVLTMTGPTVREPLTQQEIRREGIRCLKVKRK
jgi:hypothetical protein